VNNQKLVEQFFQFGIGFSALRLEMFNKVRPQSITPLQFEIVLHAYCHPNSMVSEISAALGIVVPNASREVKKLIEMDYLKRIPDSQDKRKSGIILSESGEQIKDTFNSDLGALIVERFSERSEDDVTQIIEALETLNRLLV